ncbi:MAG: type II secretion system F family protein [Clostridia bacterium]|nr:type II secretion system F family protein [Clostridia bacterium]
MALFPKEAHISDQGSVTGYDTSLTDYNVYIMSSKEKLGYIALAAAVIFTVGFIFYHSIILSALLFPLALLYPKMRTKEIIIKRKNNLNLQFKDMLYSLSASLSAGKSVESAFKDVLKDLSIIYPDPETDILREVEILVRKIEMNETLESVLSDFAARSHLEDIENFVDVFQTCKRTGGNIVEIIKNTSNIINDKIEIKQEIDTLLAQRKFEQKVLNVMPIGLILLLSLTTSDYMAPIFNTLAGRIAITFSMILLVISYAISKKIMDIKI